MMMMMMMMMLKGILFLFKRNTTRNVYSAKKGPFSKKTLFKQFFVFLYTSSRTSNMRCRARDIVPFKFHLEKFIQKIKIVIILIFDYTASTWITSSSS